MCKCNNCKCENKKTKKEMNVSADSGAGYDTKYAFSKKVKKKPVRGWSLMNIIDDIDSGESSDGGGE